METRWPRQQMLDAVERSPAMVAAQDKAGWLALFAPDGVVEDPVGTAPNRRGARVDARTGEDDLGRFWDTFIAGNEIRFAVAADLVAGDEVVRDVVIHTRLSTGLAIDVPAHLVYQLVDAGGALRIVRMRACWDLRRRSVGALGAWPRGWWTLLVMSWRMFARQGVRGVIGYSRGLVSGAFGRGRAVVARLAQAIAAGFAGPAPDGLFTDDATIELPIGRAWSPHDLRDAFGPGARLEVDRVTPAGFTISFRFTLTAPDGADRAGVALCELDRRSLRIRSLRFFTRDV